MTRIPAILLCGLIAAAAPLAWQAASAAQPTTAPSSATAPCNVHHEKHKLNHARQDRRKDEQKLARDQKTGADNAAKAEKKDIQQDTSHIKSDKRRLGRAESNPCSDRSTTDAVSH